MPPLLSHVALLLARHAICLLEATHGPNACMYVCTRRDHEGCCLQGHNSRSLVENLPVVYTFSDKGLNIEGAGSSKTLETTRLGGVTSHILCEFCAEPCVTCSGTSLQRGVLATDPARLSRVVTQRTPRSGYAGSQALNRFTLIGRPLLFILSLAGTKTVPGN
jgi:hypothetical protein